MAIIRALKLQFFIRVSRSERTILRHKNGLLETHIFQKKLSTSINYSTIVRSQKAKVYKKSQPRRDILNVKLAPRYSLKIT